MRARSWLLMTIVAALGIAGCGSSSPSTSTQALAATSTPETVSTTGAPQAARQPDKRKSKAVPKPKPNPALVPCVGGRSYGGIGAGVSAFKGQNTVGQPPSYQDGLVYYTINHRSANGCVTDYSLWEATTPTQSQRDLLTLVAGIYLPADAQQIVDQDTCMVWLSTQLAKATGHQYAVGAILVPPEGDSPGEANMAVSGSPHC